MQATDVATTKISFCVFCGRNGQRRRRWQAALTGLIILRFSTSQVGFFDAFIAAQFLAGAREEDGAGLQHVAAGSHP